MLSIEDILYQVTRPARYTGGEWNSIVKDWDKTPIRVVLAFPDTYEVGMSNLAMGRYSVAARCVGQAQACLDAALSYAPQRIIFGQKESEFQMVKQIVADMVVSIETARLLVYRLGHLLDANVGRVTSIASMTKLYASEVATKAALDAI
ncbi:MAG: hypothetical protein FJ022_05985 [Chloroflexi bacterium]|nr:hypothetical protein [Chloroflexota bacterium]MBM3175680.1 hypothetical protein [Chloroflexota bacterium]MBM4450334.1 hypothetical protein [Chloroflexota bacterium]MBM4453374.1 hypothetical protein [Chloroflexota bacterium]